MTPFAGAYRALLTGRRSIGSLLTRRSRAVGVLLTLIAALALALLGGLGDSVQGQTSNQRAVRIDVTFTGNFVQDALAAGETLPTDTTFASVAFATHQSTVSYFQPGQPASAGLKAFAESGSTTLLVDEFTAQTHPNNVYPKATQGTFPQDATAAQTFGSHRASRGQDHLTFVASFSQSPDWFVGARNIDLRPGDVWIEELEVDLFAWDAGTDSGADWDSANAATTPPGNVTSLEDAGKFSDTPIGKLTITMLVPPSHDLGPVQLRHVLQADANPLDGGLNVYWDAYYPPFKVVRSSLHTVDFDRYLVAWKSGDQEFQTALDGDRVKVVMDRNSNHTIIEGLTNGTEYTVRVTHANAVGPAVRHSRTSSATPAARERVLVSTFSQGLSHSWGLPLHLITNDFGRKYVYNRFTTGPNATNLGSVTFARIQPPLISSSPVSPTLELHLLEDLPGGEIGTNFVQPGQPGPLIGKFVSPPEYPDGPAKFVAPGDGFALSASTDYWLKLVLVQGEVVIPMTMIGGPGPHNNLDPDSLAGWDIGNACQLSLFDIWNRRNITNCSYYSNFMVLLSGPVDSTLPRASISGGSAVEGESIEFKVELSSAPSAQATVQYDTVDGSARLSATTSDNDYTAVSGGTVTFDPGETSKTISIATGDDSIDEHDERFIVRLSSPSSNIVLSELDAAAGVIINDDYTAASNSTLAGLTLTDGDGNAIALNETFDPLRFVYTADAAGEVDAVNATLSLPSGVTPRQLSWFDAFGKVEEGDQTQAGSAEFTRIVAGLNPFRVLVTSRDGSRESLYTVMMNKAASSDATIATLVLEDNSFNAFVLSPAFSPSVTDYTATVANTPPFYVDAGLNHGGADAQVSVNGTVVIPYSRSHPSDNFAMRPGQNTLAIEVTAEDGTVETYTLQVTVQFSRDVKFGQASFSVSEGSTVSVPVILNQPAPLALTLPLTATRQGGATAADYAVPLSVDFAVGDTQQTVTFAATADDANDPGESVSLAFGALPAGVSAIAPESAVVTIQDVVPGTTTVSFAQAGYTVAEGGTTTVTLTLDSAAGANVDIPISVTNQGGATAADYSTLPSTVSIAAGATQGSLTFTALDDSAVDPGESVKLTLGALPTGYVAGSTSETTVNITDTTSPPPPPPPVPPPTPPPSTTVGGGGGGFGPAPVAPKFTDGFRTTRDLPENARPGDPLGAPVSATHPDDLDISYSLSGAHASFFAVDEATGQISFVEEAELTLGNTYTVNLTATDSAGVGAIIIVLINVTEPSHHRYDLNRNGALEGNEVVAAVKDYFDGLITKNDVIEIVKLYFAGPA